MKKAEIIVEGARDLKDNPKKVADAIVSILKVLPVIEQETAQKALEEFSEATKQEINISHCTFTTTGEANERLTHE